MAKRSAPWEGGKVYPVELGESFVSHHAFHTLKYDFKPKSIDYDSLGTLASDGRNIQVTLKAKQQDQPSSDVQFSGHATECKKDSEFVLLFNPDREVFVLERLTSTIALKQNRGHKREGGAGKLTGIKGVKEHLAKRAPKKRKVVNEPTVPSAETSPDAASATKPVEGTSSSDSDSDSSSNSSEPTAAAVVAQ